jgi:transposase-like protein
MGLSRRHFTREFKLTAVRRLKAGVSLAEVARGLEVCGGPRADRREKLIVGRRMSIERMVELGRVSRLVSTTSAGTPSLIRT